MNDEEIIEHVQQSISYAINKTNQIDDDEKKHFIQGILQAAWHGIESMEESA